MLILDDIINIDWETIRIFGRCKVLDFVLLPPWVKCKGYKIVKMNVEEV